MLNPHVFRILPYPGLAPELATRSGQGNWGAYALAAPADRLLPFVLTRALVPGASRWLNCASIMHADTEEVLFTLNPTGQTLGGPGPYGLVLAKVSDPSQGVEHFLYLGALIPNLALPCGVPLRLLLDNAWQSPRFEAYADLSGFQKLEWSHPGPLSGVPYGTGLVQRFYVNNGGLQYAAPREVKNSSQDAATGDLRLDYLAKYRSATATVEPVPAYLSEALTAAELHKSFSVDGEAWRVTAVKEAAQGPDGGRWLMTLSLEQKQVLQSRLSCPAAPLAVAAYDPVLDAPRGYRCGDASDTASDFLPTGVSSCELDADGFRTGYLLQETKDFNPYSTTADDTASVRVYNEARCPLPTVFRSDYYAESATKNDCAMGEVGTSVLLASPAGKYSSRESKANANQQAIDYVQANKQDYANANGTCSTTGGGSSDYYPLYVQSGEERGCFTGQMQNANDVNDIRQATGDEMQMYRVEYVNNGTVTQCPIY